MLQAQKFSAITGEDDDDLEEESLLETPLDDFEPYSVVKLSLLRKLLRFLRRSTAKMSRSGLQSEQPQLYENLMKELDQSEQNTLQAAVQHADELATQTPPSTQVNGTASTTAA